MSLCHNDIKNFIIDEERADFIQSLYTRLKSASGVMESIIQECISIYDEIENIVNAGSNEPVSIQMPQEVIEAQECAHDLAGVLSEALLEGARALADNDVIWFAEEEEIEVNVDGNWVRCWHIENDGEIATICLGYLGGPRTQVPLSSLRHSE